MAIQTPADLEDRLDESLAWRKIELSAIRSEVRRLHSKSPDAPLTRAMVRSGTALVYAHWEGYTKEACQCYLDYVAIRKLKYSELSDSFLLTALRDMASKVDKPEIQSSMLEALRRPSDARARIPRKDMVKTRSNLRYEVLDEIFQMLGLSLQYFEMRENFIDRSLCDARNEVAHGRHTYPDPAGFGDVVSDVLAMLEHVRDLIRDHVRNTRYLAST